MQPTRQITLEDLGYDSFFEESRKQLKWDVFSVARVTVEYKGCYKVKNEKGEFWAKITGKQMFDAESREDYPAVGDWVAVKELNSEQAVIQGVIPRKTVLKRRRKAETGVQLIAANIDVAFVVESVGRDFNLNRFERYFVLANDGGIKPAIILNKIDLISAEESDRIQGEIGERFGGIDVILTSAVNDHGLEQLRSSIFKGNTYCFLGSSGVGKSSLINKLLGEKIIRTEDVSLGTNRGKHTTTTREMYFLENGGIVIDNPGMREVGMTGATAGVEGFFDEISLLSKECKFADCTHMSEKGCKVLSALESGNLDKDKYDNYISLKKEAEYYDMSELEKRDKDRRFGKMVKSAKKQFEDYKF